MKKLLIIAVVALFASAACSKIENVRPDQKINFSVANYMNQTRAQGNKFEDEFSSFTTNAWYYPSATTNAPQHYMENVVITKQTGNDAPSAYWGPAEPYYWPKTGTINFFSYASKNTVTVDAGDSAYGQSFAISGFTPVADDNIVIADAVYNAGLNVNADGSMVTDDLATGTTDSGFNGVPTMFRHLLSQVTFTIGLATTTPTVGTTNYSATIKSFTVKSAANTGSLSLTAGASSGTALNVQPWTPAADGTQVGWTASATADLAFTAPTAALTLAAGQTTGNVETVVENRTVLPQALADAVVLEIVYDLQTKHGNTVYASEENVKVTAQLNTLTIKNWCMNQRVIYNVTINPVTGLVKFDPAVAAWTTATAVAVTL